MRTGRWRPPRHARGWRYSLEDQKVSRSAQTLERLSQGPERENPTYTGDSPATVTPRARAQGNPGELGKPRSQPGLPAPPQGSVLLLDPLQRVAFHACPTLRRPGAPHHRRLHSLRYLRLRLGLQRATLPVPPGLLYAYTSLWRRLLGHANNR